MNTCRLTASITALANALSCKLNAEELALLASILVQLGDTLVTIVSQRALCNSSHEKSTNK